MEKMSDCGFGKKKNQNISPENLPVQIDTPLTEKKYINTYTKINLTKNRYKIRLYENISDVPPTYKISNKNRDVLLWS